MIKVGKQSMLSERDLQAIGHWILIMKEYESSKMKHIKAAEALRFNYELLGSGKTRIVYDLDNGYVVKIAISTMGLTSNQREVHLYTYCSPRLRKNLCPVIAYGDGWIIMKKMRRLTTLSDEHKEKLPWLRKQFLKERIEARSLRSKNLAISSKNNRIIVIDYGSFRYEDN